MFPRTVYYIAHVSDAGLGVGTDGRFTRNRLDWDLFEDLALIPPLASTEVVAVL